MTKKRFPNNWATAEIVKQYMKNHRRHAVRTGRMKPRNERRLDARLAEAAEQGQQPERRRNIDSAGEEAEDGEGSGDDADE
jgi:hypothetical protein